MQIAIVGAGIAGASTAFYSHNVSQPSSAPAVSIFESSSSVGGRIKALIPQTAPNAIVRGQADAQFSTDEWCLMNAMRDAGLRDTYPYPFSRPRSMGVWDGAELRMQLEECEVESLSWWELARMAWRYGSSFQWYRQAVKSNQERWKSFADQNTFVSVVDELKRAGLDGHVMDSAKDYLQGLGVGPDFRHDFVQPCTRARFGQNLEETRGLSSLVIGGKSKATSVGGGNKRLVEHMIERSKATLKLNSEVTKITRGDSGRYKVTVSVSNSDPTSPLTLEHPEFDAVVLATPLQSSNVDLSDLELDRKPSVPYSEAHVTQFTTLEALSPRYFNLSLNGSLPDDILTTTTKTGNPDLLSFRRFTACYKRGCLPGDDCDECELENHYMVLSRSRREDEELVKSIGRQFTEGHDLSDYGIDWVHRSAWPYAYPKYHKDYDSFGKIEIAPNLFYLGGAEDVLSSMEMSCRMGQNAAKLLSSTQMKKSEPKGEL